jgi:hypothetical protein
MSAIYGLIYIYLLSVGLRDYLLYYLLSVDLKDYLVYFSDTKFSWLITSSEHNYVTVKNNEIEKCPWMENWFKIKCKLLFKNCYVDFSFGRQIHKFWIDGKVLFYFHAIPLLTTKV